MNYLVAMNINCGRMGILSGCFTCTEAELRPFDLGKAIYFGEVLGKHSEIACVVKLGEGLEIISADQVLVDGLLERFPSRVICGYSPVEYLAEQEAAAREV